VCNRKGKESAELCHCTHTYMARREPEAVAVLTINGTQKKKG